MSNITNPKITKQQQIKQMQLAVQRALYLKKLTINVKQSKKTQDQDQLIVIETYDMDKKHCVQLVIRKLSQLDYLIEHLNEKYGGHIIPCLKSDFFFQKDINIETVIPEIQEYLSDLQKNKYCRQDMKFYCFLLEQNMKIPKVMTYDKVLNQATDFSRKYLSELFTRKSLPELENIYQYVQSHNYFVEEVYKYRQVKSIALIKLNQVLNLQEIMLMFSDLQTGHKVLALPPHDHDFQKFWNNIKKTDKLIKQAEQAHLRWDLLRQHTQQLRNNVYKGLHEDIKICQKKMKLIQSWNQSLTIEYDQLVQYLYKKMEVIVEIVCKIYRQTIRQSLPDSLPLLEIQSHHQKMQRKKSHNAQLRKSIESQIIKCSLRMQEQKNKDKIIENQQQANKSKSDDLLNMFKNLTLSGDLDSECDREEIVNQHKQNMAILVMEQVHKKQDTSESSLDKQESEQRMEIKS